MTTDEQVILGALMDDAAEAVEPWIDSLSVEEAIDETVRLAYELLAAMRHKFCLVLCTPPTAVSH